MTWITKGRAADYPVLGQVMFHTVRTSATAYTMPERAAWMPHVPGGMTWARRLSRMQVYVARGSRGVLGFTAVTRAGYVDFAYVIPKAQGRGVFRDLMTRLIAERPGVTLTTHASLQAQPAFQALGFTTQHHEIVRRKSQRLRRAFMQLDQSS